MENAAEALKLSAWVLIFVVALSISMSSFGQAKEGIDALLNASDREYLTEYIPQSGDTERTVGFESIIPAIYRSFKENYKIVFEDYTLYKYEGTPVNYIDLTVNGFTDRAKEEFINRVLYGINKYNTPADKEYTKSHFGNYEFTLENGIYGLIKGNKFHEKLGVYYIGEEHGATLAPEANKITKRVIRYKKI